MRAILFRKIIYEGNTYYQLYKEDKDFKPDSSFADFIHRDTKDFFYIDADSDIEIEDASILNIYHDVDGKFAAVKDYELFEKVLFAFKDKFNFAIREVVPVKEVVRRVSEEILYQDIAVEDIVEQIYLNQGIMASDLPIKMKVILKNNILFHGPLGSGKKSIIEKLEETLNIPYADVKITANFKETLESIIVQLLERSENEEEASHGIVFIRDNFMNLLEVLGDKVYTAPAFFTDKAVIEYHGKLIDFRKLTFVVLLDEQYDFDGYNTDIDSIMTMADCTFRAATRILTDKQKYDILMSKKGRLRLYSEFLADYDKKMIIDSKSLKRIIRECSKMDVGMNLLNSIIDGIMKESLMYGVHDVVINKECADTYLPALKTYAGEENIKSLPKKEDKEEKEKKIEEIWDEELDKLTKAITADVIGQDKQVKSILYTILENRRMINRTDLKNPKDYVKNILIRGESGSGKTMIIDRIKNLLNVPVFIADSTQYTDTGWVGDSVSDMLVGLVNAANGDVEAAQKGILIIDEIDKKADNGEHGGPSRKAVLDNMLKSIEGAEISINVGNKLQEEKILFDTSRLTVICSGAFEGLEKIRDKRVGASQMGFGREEKEKTKGPITDEDYITYGMNRQFIARLGNVVELNKITKESLINIMKNSNSSKLKIEKFKLEDRGIEVEYTEDFYDHLADVVLKMKVGARGIEKALNNVLNGIGIEDIKSSEIAKITFNKDVIDDPNKVILYHRSPQKKLIY